MLLKLVTLGETDWTYEQLAQELGMSRSAVHEAVSRAQRARLLHERTVNRQALAEFLEHGVRYAFFSERGPVTRGMPTGAAAPPLSEHLSQNSESPVWPIPDGDARGYALNPLFKSVPFAARKDSQLYELLALTDALREGVPREVLLARQELRRRLLGRD